MKANNFFKILVLAAGMSFPLITNAQATPPDDPNDNAPVDGGLSILLAAGVGYGVKRLHEKNKKKLNNKNEDVLMK